VTMHVWDSQTMYVLCPFASFVCSGGFKYLESKSSELCLTHGKIILSRQLCNAKVFDTVRV